MFVQVLIGFMVLLGTWAVVNIVLWRTHRNSTRHMAYYWQMNGLWNIVNLSIALGSIVSALVNASSYQNSAATQKFIIWLVAINILADLLYVGFGTWLESRGKKDSNVRYRGYGLSIQLQGAFLFLFDTLLVIGLIISVL